MKSYHLLSCGMPKYYLNKKFDTKYFKPYITNGEMKMTPAQQTKQLKAIMEEEPGWLMYICASGFLYNVGLLASDIANNYVMNNLNVAWLTKMDIKKEYDIDRILKADLIVIDALFANGSTFFRDQAYSTITSYCQREDQSLIVMGQAPTPKDFVKYVGLPPSHVFQVM